MTRDDIQLTGEKAEVDFTKGESRLLGQGKGRVRALLTPGGAVGPKSEKAKTIKPNAGKVDKGKAPDQKAIQKVPLP